MQKDIIERLKARRTSRSSVTIDENLRHDIDDAILELQRLRAGLKRICGLPRDLDALQLRSQITPIAYEALKGPRNWIDNRLAVGLPYEGAEITMAAACIQANGLDTLVDVGANIGLYTVRLGQMPEIQMAYCFEPVRRNFNQMLGNVFANELDEKVEAFRLALSDRAEDTTIHVDPSSTGVSRLDLTDSGRSPESYARTETVRTARGDDVLPLAGRRIYMKIDVEGHAACALLGMPQLFANNVVFVQVEASDTEAPHVAEILASYGLALASVTGDDRFFAPQSQSNAPRNTPAL